MKTNAGQRHDRWIVDLHEYENFVSKENKRLLADFLIEKRAQNKTSTTLKHYESNMKIILTFLHRHFNDKLLTDLTRKDIRNLSILLQERGLSSARVNSYLSSLRSALEVFMDDDELDYEFNIGTRVKGIPKEPVREITFLTDEQVQWLKETLLKKDNLIQAMYLMLSYTSAARKNEVYQVLKDGLENKFATNVVSGKGRKKFRLYYDQDTQFLIREYLKYRGNDEISQLFVKLYRNGEKKLVNPATFNAWCDEMGKMLSKQEGRKIHINPHSFRHSRLQNLSKQSIPLEKLKALANHTQIATTIGYLKDSGEEDIAEIFGMDISCFTV